MATREQIVAKIRAINAKSVSYDTGEKWVDDNGSQYNIERKPTDWARNAKSMYMAKER